MSYRTIKMLLGETSLERKCRRMFGICLLLLITGSFWWYSGQTEKLVVEASRNHGRGVVNAIMLKHHWEFTQERELDKDLLQYFARELIDDDYKWYFIRPSGEVRPFGRSVEKDDANDVDSVADADGPQSQDDLGHSDRRDDEADGDSEIPGESLLNEFERELLLRVPRRVGLKTIKEPSADAKNDAATGDALKSDATTSAVSQDVDEFKSPVFADRRLSEVGEYHYYQAVYHQKNCVMCHSIRWAQSYAGVPGMQSPEPGDLIGLVKVVVPDAKVQHDINVNRAILAVAAIVTVFLSMVAAYIIVRYVIVKPLQHLRDVSDEISHGNTALRADIHTGDEFEQLGVAFNRMVRHLTHVQDELRTLNTNLDQKVDELAQVNMQLYEANRLKSDFLATMSHELRTPLNAIIGFSDVLSTIDSLDERQKRYVRNIQSSGKSLLEMINDILDLAKIESGKMELRPSDFRIEAVVSALCDMARPLSERKNIDLESEVAPDLPTLFQDQAKVQQILNNLLSNAIKFTPEGGRIIVSVKPSDNESILLTVADTGIGIAEEDQQAIFEKFRQGTSVLSGGDAITREYSGTGLGLSIVKELCRLLGGEVALQSELGRGSTFTIELPLYLPGRPTPLPALSNAAHADRD